MKPKQREGFTEKQKSDKKRETRTQRNERKKIAREKRKDLNNLFFIPDGLRGDYFVTHFVKCTCCQMHGKNSCLGGRRLGIWSQPCY